MAKTPVPTKAAVPVPAELPRFARTDFAGLQRHIDERVTMRRQDNTLVRGTLVSIAHNAELGEAVATLLCEGEATETVIRSELQYWLPPTKENLAAREPGASRRTGVPVVLTLQDGDDLLAAITAATGTEVTLAPSRTDRFNPVEVDDDWEDVASSTYVNEFEQADEIEGEEETVQAGEPIDAEDLFDDDAVMAARDALIEQEIPAEEPPAEKYDLQALGEQIDAALKRSPRAAKAAATRAFPKAAQLGKAGAKKPAKK